MGVIENSPLDRGCISSRRSAFSGKREDRGIIERRENHVNGKGCSDHCMLEEYVLLRMKLGGLGLLLFTWFPFEGANGWMY